MKRETLQTLFVSHISDIYDAEKQLVKALPKLAKAVESPDLAEALRHHLAETENHVTRLEEVFQMAGVAAKAKPCKGMKGLIEEGSEAIEENPKGILRDLAVIAGAQKAEHYEISGYGTARTIAEQLGMKEASQLLRKTENEEEKADDSLTKLAMALYQSYLAEGVPVGAAQGAKRAAH